MKKSYLFIVLICLLSASCLDKREYSAEELQKLVDSRLEELLTSYRNTKIERCKEALIQEANSKVDSIIFAESQEKNSPGPIPKPLKPEIRAIPDTRPIVPLFDSIRTIPVKTDTL